MDKQDTNYKVVVSTKTTAKLHPTAYPDFCYEIKCSSNDGLPREKLYFCNSGLYYPITTGPQYRFLEKEMACLQVDVFDHIKKTFDELILLQPQQLQIEESNSQNLQNDDKNIENFQNPELIPVESQSPMSIPYVSFNDNLSTILPVQSYQEEKKNETSNEKKTKLCGEKKNVFYVICSRQ